MQQISYKVLQVSYQILSSFFITTLTDFETYSIIYILIQNEISIIKYVEGRYNTIYIMHNTDRNKSMDEEHGRIDKLPEGK